MGSYTIIADTSRSIIELLRAKMTPEPMQKQEMIGLCEPGDRGSYILGIHLFNIEENGELRQVNPVNLGGDERRNPPLTLSLSYMISVMSKSDISSRAIDEQRILGKAAQVLHDYRRIPEEHLVGTIKDYNENIEINLMNLTLEEKVRIWSSFNEPYRLSMFYKVGPINLESDIIRKTKRVVDMSVTIKEK